MNLLEYSDPKNYPEIYQHNFEQIDRIDGDPTLSGLTERLSTISDIDYKIILLELKRYLMNSIEYRQKDINDQKHKSKHLIWKAVNKSFILLSKILYGNKRKPLDILIDDWSEGVLENFYGNKMITTLQLYYCCRACRFPMEFIANPLYLFKFVWPLLSCINYNNKVIREHGIDLKIFIFIFFRNVIIGKSLHDIYQPKLIISGNDNGFPVIIGKSSGAKILLIQNAKKTLFSDATFKYADYYVSMGDLDYSNVLINTGCKFNKILPFGSMRLHNSLNQLTNKSIEQEYDILWISDLEPTLETGSLFNNYYHMNSEIAAIKLLNNYAVQHKTRIAFKCRLPNEMEQLRGLNLISDRLTYIGRFDENVYQTVLKSDLILSTLSSVVFESLGISKKVGYVNLSGNTNVNFDVRDLNIEFNLSSRESFTEFIDRLKVTQPQFEKYITQNQNYIDDLLIEIENIIKRD